MERGYCDVFVCVSVCVSLPAPSYTSNVHQIFVELPVARSSCVDVANFVYFRFMDDVVFASL